MNTVIMKKQKSSKQDELEKMFEMLLKCLPPYEEVKFFLDLVIKHYSFNYKDNKEPNLIILGTSIPDELIYASGVEPYWILGGSRVLSTFADDSVPRDTDPVSRAMLGCLQNDIENFSKNKLILIPLINDSSKKLAYILKSNGYQVHTVYIPPTEGQVSNQELFRQGNDLVDAIYKYTGKQITKRSLFKAQLKIAEARKQIRHFIQITYKNPCLIPSIWRMFILHSYYCTSNLEDWSYHLSILNNHLAANSTQKNAKQTCSALMLGSPIYFPNYKIPFLMHDIKLNVVVHLDYTTGKFFQPNFVNKELSIEMLMQSFYKNDCSSAYIENRYLLRTVSRILDEMQIDGIVYHVLKGQIEYDFELERLEELFSSHSIPICRLETDYNYQDIEQLRIRLEAFQEVLSQRQFKKEESLV